MHLKQTILALLSPEALKEICGHLDMDLNCRTKAAMVRHLLPQESISAERLLPLLTEAELQAVCAACGVPATGRKATLVKRLVKQARGPTFVALDFETADYPRDSACALGLVRVENHRIVRRTYHLIRPPRRRFAFTYLHSIAPKSNTVHLKGGDQNVGRALPAKILKTNSRGRLFYIILP